MSQVGDGARGTGGRAVLLSPSVSGLRSALTWLLFHRFHLGVALLFFAFPLFAISWGASLFANLFVLSGAELAVVAALAQLLGHSIVATLWTSTRNGPLRLWPGLESPAAEDAIRLGFREFRNAFRRSWGTKRRWESRLTAGAPAVALALALPTLAIAGRRSEGAAIDRLLAIAAGLAAAELLRSWGALATAWLTPPETRHRFAGGTRAGRALAVFGRLHTPRFARRLREWLTAFLARAPFGPGYVWVDPQGRRYLHTGHLAAAGLFATSALVYVAVGIAEFPRDRDPSLPALGALLLVLNVAAWALPALSFLLDRFRVPVVPALLLVSALLYTAFGADHYFALRAPAAPLPARADEDLDVVDGWFEGDGSSPPRPIIAVAAAGGGITASAWTAAALTGLASGEGGGEFLASLKLISGVSGGAVGAMFFVDRLPDAPLAGIGAMGPLSADRVAAIRAAASASSLDAAAWGLAYPDLLRILFSFPVATLWPEVDRSWALEQSWRHRLSGAPTLAGWRRDARAGKKPFVLLNATAVETGERFVLPTLAIEGGAAPSSFFAAFTGKDVEVGTAARLSASFPFVSLASRARVSKGSDERNLPQAHFVDGGYTENSGLLSALEILDGALARHCPGLTSCLAPPIVLIRLSPFDPNVKPLPTVRSSSAWVTAGLAPLETLMSVREASQKERNGLELEFFEAKWEARGVKVEVLDFDLQGLGPLSWKLTAEERRRIWQAWARVKREPMARASGAGVRVSAP